MVTPTALIGTSTYRYAAPPMTTFGMAAGFAQQPMLSQGGNNPSAIVAETASLGGYGYGSVISPSFSYAFQSTPISGASTIMPASDIGFASLNPGAGQFIQGTSGMLSNRISMDFGSMRPTGAYANFMYPGWR